MKLSIQYIAGLVDGEGTISYGRQNRLCYPGPYISVCNSNRLVIVSVFATLKCGHLYVVKRRKRSYKTMYVWKVSNVVALVVIRRLLPHLVVKKEQARLVLKHKQLTHRNGRYTKDQLQKKVDQINAVRRLNNSRQLRLTAKTL